MSSAGREVSEMEPRQIVSRFFDCLDRGELEPLIELFAQDAVLVDEKGRRLEGRERIREYFQAPAWRFWNLHVSHSDNPVIADFTWRMPDQEQRVKVHESFFVEGGKIKSVEMKEIARAA